MKCRDCLESRDTVVKSSTQAEQQEENSSGSRDLGIQRLLRQRAKERAAPLRWNANSVIFGYSLLAAVIIMSLKDVELSITIVTAVLGLAALGLSSWLRIRKLEHTFYEEEVEDYARLASGESSERGTETVENNSMESPLTSRETAVLEQMAKGASSKAIADALEISPQTVKNHISHVFSKLGVTDRTSAVLIGLRQGWIKDGHGSLRRSSDETEAPTIS